MIILQHLLSVGVHVFFRRDSFLNKSSENYNERPHRGTGLSWGALLKLEYLAVYGRASVGVPVGKLQSTQARTTDCDWSAIGPPTHFCHGQKRDYLSR